MIKIIKFFFIYFLEISYNLKRFLFNKETRPRKKVEKNEEIKEEKKMKLKRRIKINYF